MWMMYTGLYASHSYVQPMALKEPTYSVVTAPTEWIWTTATTIPLMVTTVTTLLLMVKVKSGGGDSASGK